MYTLPSIDPVGYTWDFLLDAQRRESYNEHVSKRTVTPTVRPELVRPAGIQQSQAPGGMVSIDLDSDDETADTAMVVEQHVTTPVIRATAAAEQLTISRDRLDAVLHRMSK